VPELRPASTGAIVLLALAMAIGVARAADGELYFANAEHVRLDSQPVVHGVHEAIALELTLNVASQADLNRLPPLKVGGRDASAAIDIMEFRGGQPYLPAAYLLDAAPSIRIDGTRETLALWFRIGRSALFYWVSDHFGLIGRYADKQGEGTYRIGASYRMLNAPPIFVTIR
jgi:hypothetical protein